MTSRWHAEKQQVLETSQAMYRRGLVVGAAGNVSMRVGGPGEELLAITPSKKHYDDLTVDDIQVIDFDFEPVEGDLVPSIESPIHVASYQARADIRALVHTHSIYASTLAVARLDLPPLIDELIVMVGGNVKVAEYGFPSSDELAAALAEALRERNAAFLANHGLVGVGADLREALTICELVERASHIYVMARAIGQVNLLPDEVVDAEMELFKMMHRQEHDPA
jgi:L-fuculose-phosphate aldolase